MALKDWDDIPFAANDCIRDHNEWNDMVTYIRHSACTTFTIYSTCPGTGQAFRFTETGNFSQMYGSGTVGHDLMISANDGEMRPRILLYGGGDIKLDSGDDVYFLENGVERFQFYDGKSIDFLGDRAIHIDDDETYIGHGAGDGVTTGTDNTLVGYDAGNAITSALRNTLIGSSAGHALVDGNYNVAVGYYALFSSISDERNTAIGDYALAQCNGGTHNTAVGKSALATLTTGDYNTVLGVLAGESTTIQNSCVFLGYSAGQNSVASNRLYINNSNSAFPLIYGEFDNDLVKIGNNSDDFGLIFDANTAGIGKIYGGDDAGDDLLLQANTTNAYSYIKLLGGSHIEYQSDDEHRFYKDGTEHLRIWEGGGELIMQCMTNTYFRLSSPEYITFAESDDVVYLKFHRAGTDAMITGYTANDDIYINPTGTGLVKWGTEQTNAGSDRGELIPMKTAAGTTVYLKTYNLV